ncbi:NAD(P)-dependent dehydrogenase, short-chain alcohol dehydrogenase family [Arthrobacter sp. 9AX]|uniref:SDR family NAD(P)-dependent oxidoreductase n=1 Tax=Arthrobacter sp. 9AX TaxID=2653131 RepID=UPI0012F22963|nr:SDR family NAD(P)-dependent oxidoreductase [Arthrobacter sp. 9AX]VXB21660.1 NAD(P)-dependent dehydrogenase, short-chain alcohol dehydrogenase family [Arthrobacter sp. 9AX]
MARIFITGSADGLGRHTAGTFLENGHDVVVHVRNPARLDAVRDLLDQGASVVTGDLADPEQTRDVAEQVNKTGRVDAVIHNAGVLHSPDIFQVKVVAPYLLTALIDRPQRLVYLSSGMHRGGHADLTRLYQGTDNVTYSDSKLYLTALAAGVARLLPDVLSNAVDPGWVPTRMGGAGAPDDLRLGHLTQEWLATSDDPAALTSGGYWFHQHREKPHPAARDERFQDGLLDYLAEATGERLA